MMNESLLSEFLLESVPQLIIQGINNTITGQWTEIVTLSSFIISLTIVVNSIWRFAYWKLIEKIPIGDVPIFIKIPFTSIKIKLKRDNTDVEIDSNRTYNIRDMKH